jgi:hypothetical protein
MRGPAFNPPAVVLWVPAVQVNSTTPRTVNRQLSIPPLLSRCIGIVPPREQLDQHAPEDRQFFFFCVGFHFWNFPPRKEVLDFFIPDQRTPGEQSIGPSQSGGWYPGRTALLRSVLSGIPNPIPDDPGQSGISPGSSGMVRDHFPLGR